jgi:hypothetical protein
MAEGFKEFGPFAAVMRRHLARLALGTLAGLAAAGAAVGLMSLSGWFIAAAAVAGLAPATAVLFNFFLPSIGVRLFAILRTAARYAERVFTHEATFRILESLRVWFYRRIEPLAPAGLWRFRSGDILNRIVSDIEALDNLYLRVLSPAAVALLVSLLVCSLLAAFDGGIAATSGLLLALAGIGVSAAAARAGAAAGHAIAARSADLRAPGGRPAGACGNHPVRGRHGTPRPHGPKPVGSDRRRAADGLHPGRGGRGGEPSFRDRRAGGPLRGQRPGRGRAPCRGRAGADGAGGDGIV